MCSSTFEQRGGGENSLRELFSSRRTHPKKQPSRSIAAETRKTWIRDRRGDMTSPAGGEKAGVLETCVPSVWCRERDMGTENAWTMRKNGGTVDVAARMEMGKSVETTLAKRDYVG